MVFNQYYDRALLLMLLADKSNNALIMNFLNFMPDELYKYICEVVSEKFTLMDYCNYGIIKFEQKTVVTEDDVFYVLNGGIIGDTLEIKLNRFNSDMKIDEKIELSLKPILLDKLEENTSIGNFYYELNIGYLFDKNHKCDVYSKNYNVIKRNLNSVIIDSSGKYKGKRIFINSCLDDISLDSLFNDRRFNSKKKILSNKKKRYN